MFQTRLDEPLGWLLARFEKGMISPVRFRWKSREFEVTNVNARWVDRAVRPIRYGFSVSVRTGEVMELEYREGDPVWYVMGVA